MMGKMGDNWKNTVFAEHAHSLLQETTTIGDETTKGISRDVARLVDKAGPLVVRHIDAR
jgi:hypothetical protein